MSYDQAVDWPITYIMPARENVTFKVYFYFMAAAVSTKSTESLLQCVIFKIVKRTWCRVLHTSYKDF